MCGFDPARTEALSPDWTCSMQCAAHVFEWTDNCQICNDAKAIREKDPRRCTGRHVFFPTPAWEPFYELVFKCSEMTIQRYMLCGPRPPPPGSTSATATATAILGASRAS